LSVFIGGVVVGHVVVRELSSLECPRSPSLSVVFLLLSINSVVESSFIIAVLLDIVGSESLFILVSVVGIVVVVDFCRRRRERCPWSSSVVVVVFVCLVAVSGSRRRYWMMPS
jgi:hypothetical protein